MLGDCGQPGVVLGDYGQPGAVLGDCEQPGVVLSDHGQPGAVLGDCGQPGVVLGDLTRLTPLAGTEGAAPPAQVQHAWHLGMSAVRSGHKDVED